MVNWTAITVHTGQLNTYYNPQNKTDTCNVKQTNGNRLASTRKSIFPQGTIEYFQDIDTGHLLRLERAYLLHRPTAKEQGTSE